MVTSRYPNERRDWWCLRGSRWRGVRVLLQGTTNDPPQCAALRMAPFSRPFQPRAPRVDCNHPRGRGGTPVTRVPCAALKSVTLEDGVSGPVLRVTFINGVSLCAVRPCAMRVQQMSNGAECAVEVDTADAGFIRLAFRATALPEQLDGMAPGELSAEAWT